MREVLCLGGKRHYEEEFEKIHEIIERLYPGCERHGSAGCWIWYSNQKAVAEAWAAARKPGWYYRVVPPSQ